MSENEKFLLFLVGGVVGVCLLLAMFGRTAPVSLESEIDTIQYPKVMLFLTEYPEFDKTAKGMLENDGIITVNEYRWLMKQRDKYQKESIKKRIITQ